MMNYRIEYSKYILYFKEPAKTSRATMRSKTTYFVRISSDSDPLQVGYGEIPWFEGLSVETEEEILNYIRILNEDGRLEDLANDINISSLSFGLQQALYDLKNGGKGIIFPSDYIKGSFPIEINGLIWMGNYEEMKRRLKEKIDEGFSCIKIKIGSIRWEDEISLIRTARDLAGDKTIIRVDANGAFNSKDCLSRLEDLAKFKIHSIEQPLARGNYSDMKKICAESPIPVALDEELIGIPTGDFRSEILDYIKPHLLILKPALCYGFSGATDWIKRAEERNIGWWLTSALESSVGLNAIAQYAATYRPSITQGLGTGNLYTNNLLSPLKLDGPNLTFKGPGNIYYSGLQKLVWKH